MSHPYRSVVREGAPLPPGVPFALAAFQLANQAAAVQVAALAPCKFKEDALRIRRATEPLTRIAKKALGEDGMELLYDETGTVETLLRELMAVKTDKWPELVALVRAYNRGDVTQVE